MVSCHPVMVHCAAPNRGTRPRFMRIKTQILAHEDRDSRRLADGRFPLGQGRSRGREEHRGELRELALD
jgi:hypothetical protein